MPTYTVIVETAGDGSHAAERSPLIERVEKHGGKYLVGGAPVVVVEGGPDVQRVAVIEYDSVEAARTAFETEEYAKYSEARTRAGALATVVIAEGL